MPTVAVGNGNRLNSSAHHSRASIWSTGEVTHVVDEDHRASLDDAWARLQHLIPGVGDERRRRAVRRRIETMSVEDQRAALVAALEVMLAAVRKAEAELRALDDEDLTTEEIVRELLAEDE